MGCLLGFFCFVFLPLAVICYIVEYAYCWIKEWPQRKLLRIKRRTEESGYKVVFNKYVKDYLQAESYLLQMDAMKELLRKKSEEEFLSLTNHSEKDKFEDLKEAFLLEYQDFCSNQNEKIKDITATGENEYYKELLQNEEWKNKSELIKGRDVYCQHCFSLIKLEKIDEIVRYTDFKEIGNIIIDIFQRKEFLIKEHSESCSCTKFEIKKRIEGLNENLFMFKFYPVNFLPNWLFERNMGEILSTNQLYAESELEGYIFNKKTPEYTYKKKYTNGLDSDIVIEYFPSISTGGNIYLRHRFGYTKRNINGQGILTQDGFSVIFPLYNLEKHTATLDVHHKVYRNGKNPWESPDEELITLCHSCHIKEHLIHLTPVYS